MRAYSGLVLSCSIALLAGCAATREKQAAGFMPPEGQHRLVVMPPDVQAGYLTAGGKFQVRKDWSDRASGFVADALESYPMASSRTIARSAAEAGADPAVVESLLRLHDVVGRSIHLHKFEAYPLPTKKGDLDWTLGEQAVQYGRISGYDYALFLRARDSFTSEGRTMLQVGAVTGCVLADLATMGLTSWFCGIPLGGSQVAFVSLVDLKTGKVVWYGKLTSMIGDIRSEAGARALVQQLLRGLQPAGASGGPK